MSIQAEALQRALTLLKLGQVEYHLRLPDGRELVSEGFVPPAPAKPKRTRRVGLFMPIYHPIMEGMQPGDIKDILCPPELKLDELQAAMTSWASHHWGKQSYITEMDKEERTVTVARVL